MSALDKPIEDIPTPVYIKGETVFEPLLFFDADRFWEFLRSNYHHVDIATYSINPLVAKGVGKIDRLITGLAIPKYVAKATAKRHKHVPNNHAKIFIGYFDECLVNAVFIGSQNLTHGTNHNITYRVHMTHALPIVSMFNKMWGKTK